VVSLLTDADIVVAAEHRLKACDLCIIWADAAGTAYGLLCGPLCSIIEGAVFSTVAYMNSSK